jgi:hypothetical protein
LGLTKNHSSVFCTYDLPNLVASDFGKQEI